jgi:hypothetical protein
MLKRGANMKNLKRGIVSLALVSAFVLSIGAFSTANAQGWRRDRDRDGIPDRYETRRGRPDFNRNGVPDQWERNRGNYGTDRNRNGVDDRYENNRYGNRSYGYGRNDGYYDNYGYGRNGGNYGYGNNGYNNEDYQKGYRDGLHRGRSDAQTNRIMDPNNSSHYRKGNPAYRQGFEQGFYQSYRQYSGRRW